MDKIRQLQDMINESNRIVFFGGAGVSTESNIPDFRSADGLYKQKYRYSPEQIVSHSFFMQHTEEFYDFYKEKMMFLDAKPNKAHLKLAELEAAGKLTAVITQYRRTPPGCRKQKCTGASWKYPPQLLHALQKAVQCTFCKRIKRNPNLRLRRNYPPGCSSLRRRTG